MISNKNFINYKVLNLVELYNFDINFVFIRLHLKKIIIYLCCSYFKDGWHKQPSLKIASGFLNGTAPENRFSVMVTEIQCFLATLEAASYFNCLWEKREAFLNKKIFSVVVSIAAPPSHRSGVRACCVHRHWIRGGGKSVWGQPWW
jgi:hypothetical protein